MASAGNSSSAKCKKYIDIIKQNVGQDDGSKTALNIVVLGQIGIGKSSFINTLAAALSQQRWREHAQVGSYGGGARPITGAISKIPKCGNDISFKEYLLPTLLDIEGVEDDNSELYSEMLKIVFYGVLPEGDSLISAYNYGAKNGVEALREKYEGNPEKLKVDRVIMMVSATEEIPTNLINCVRRTAQPYNDQENKRAIPLFGVMTKIDKVGQDGVVSEEVFKEREKLFMETLGLLGATNRYLKMKNYCDETAPERITEVYPEIDEPVLRFMTQLSDPYVRVINSHCTYKKEPKPRAVAAEPVYVKKPWCSVM